MSEPTSTSAPASVSGVKTVITTGVQAATDALTGTGGDVAAAFNAFAQAATAIAEEAVSAAGGPIAGMVADAVLPQIIGNLSTALEKILVHIGAEIPLELKNVQSWLDGKLGIPETPAAS